MHMLFRALSSLVLFASLCSCGVFNSLFGEDEPSGDIMMTLADTGQHRTFISAVQTAGLVEIVSGSQIHTVFAPSDRAFEKLPAGTMEALLTPPYQQQLKQFVRNHIVAGVYTASDLNAESLQLKSLNNEWIAIDAASDLKVNSAKVLRANREATNGIVHQMDSVLMIPILQ